MKIQNLFIKKACNLLRKIDKEMYVYLDGDKITFQNIMDGNTTLAEVTYNLKCEKREDAIVLEINKLLNFLSILNDDDYIDFTIKDEYVELKCKSYNRKIRLIVPEKPRFEFPDERKEEPLLFTHDIDIFSSYLKNAIVASKDIKGNINLSFNKDSLVINKESNLDAFMIDIKKDITINKSLSKISNMYNNDYIMMLLSNVDGKINIKTKAEAPIKFTTSPIRGLTIKYMIAPLVRDDNQEFAE